MDYFEFEKKKLKKVDLKDNNDNDDKDKDKKDDKKGLEDLNKKFDPEDKINDDIKSKEEKVNIEKSIRNRIEYDMSQTKKTMKMRKEDKVEMELMRRWRVKIFNIYITTLKEKLDPFLQFTIGGDFRLQIIRDKKGNTIKKPTGKRGFSAKTEVLTNIDALVKRGFDSVIETEMRMTYSMINSQKLMIELWDYDSFWTNKIKGYCTENLIDIVNGNINLSVTILNKDSNGKNPMPYAIIDFKFLFQEIFDFKLTFINWKMGCVLTPERKKELENSEDPNIKRPDLQIEVCLENHGFLQANTNVKSEICKNSDTPNWSDFNGCIIFRGCIDDLEAQNLIINLYKHSFLFKTCISSKTVNLKGILHLERIKTQMTLVEENDNSKYYPSIEGGVTIEPAGATIRYKQIGDNVTLLTTKKYLCLKIMRVENIKPPEAMGLVDSFITAEWCGYTQRTNTCKENNNPNFNEILYFPAPFPPEYVKNPELYIQKINEELATKNEVIFNLMIEGDNNTYDNLGIGFFHLSELKNGEKNNYKYFALDKKKDINYISRVFTGKAKLTSAFSTSKLTYLNFEAWFLEDFPDLVDYGEKKDKESKLDKIPVELDHMWNHKKNKNEFLAHHKRQITKDFAKQSSYSFKERLFFELIKKDQYENEHFLPYFLSVITVPEKKYSKEEIEKNQNFFDCNIKTLDEAAHYVRCYPFNAEKGDVTVTPDFLLKTRKGDLDDHAILLACLMMGLKKEVYKKKGKMNNINRLDYEDYGGMTNNGNVTRNANNTTTDGINNNNLAIEEKDVFPFENRVFVCMGKMKGIGNAHCWIMTIDDNYKDVTFWDPRVNSKFSLKGRVENSGLLKRFLNREIKTKKDFEVQGNQNQNLNESFDEEEDPLNNNKANDIFDDRNPNGENDDDINNYTLKNDSYDEIGLDLEVMNDKDMVNNAYEAIKLKKKKYGNMIDEKIINKKADEGDEKVGYNFIQENNKLIQNEMDGENDKYFLPQDKFYDQNQNLVNPVYLPYETIDLIFNRNNIFSNYQYFDPSAIYYDIYDEKRWKPFYDLNINSNVPIDNKAKQKIWTGLFESFYPLCNFGPPLSPNLVNKMREALIKEVRIGITISRSSNNLQTKFKKKNEQINTILSQYCEYMEKRALNRISEAQFSSVVLSWKEQIKTKIPKYFKMDARCMHFNFYDLERIRKNIDEDLKSFYNRKEKNCVFATSAKIFPYHNHIVSVRIIIAVFLKIPEYEVPTAELEDYRMTLKEDKDKLIEEEQSDEEEPVPEEANNNDKTITPNNPNNISNNKNENNTRRPGETAKPIEIELKKK